VFFWFQQNTSDYVQDWQIQPKTHEQSPSDFVQDWQFSDDASFFGFFMSVAVEFSMHIKPSSGTDKQIKLLHLSGMRGHWD